MLQGRIDGFDLLWNWALSAVNCRIACNYFPCAFKQVQRGLQGAFVLQSVGRPLSICLIAPSTDFVCFRSSSVVFSCIRHLAFRWVHNDFRFSRWLLRFVLNCLQTSFKWLVEWCQSRWVHSCTSWRCRHVLSLPYRLQWVDRRPCETLEQITRYWDGPS